MCFSYDFQWRPEVIPTRKTTLVHYTIDRSIITESFIILSSAVSEIIRRQNSFLKKEKRRYLRTGSEFLQKSTMYINVI